MASPPTTHVIEIEAGIGEPAFIPLVLGQELQPMSVGKTGMWRIDSPRVLDVHAFVYFDGNALFLQSADEQSAASVDGFRVGKAWTELHAPCKIEIGSARLRYRSLRMETEDQPTLMAKSPPVQAPSGGPGAPQRAPEKAQQSAPAMVFPKTERPFKPGEFSARPDDESTRVAPLDTTGASRALPRPAAGQPASEHAPSTRPMERALRGATGSLPSVQVTGTGAYTAMPGAPLQSAPPGPYGQAPFDAQQQHLAAQQAEQVPRQGYDPHQHQLQHGYGSQAPPNQGGYGAMNGPGMPPPGAMGPGGYGAPPPPGGAPAPTRRRTLVTTLKANSIPKIVAMVLLIIGTVLFLMEEDEPEVRPKKVAARADGGAEAGSAASASASASASSSSAAPVVVVPATEPTTHSWPANVPCPPPNWPANTPLPCTPNAAGQTADKTAPRPGKEPKDAGAALPAGAKTLERQAVDLVIAGEAAKAAAAYEELVRRDPNNKVYAEAARILRAKLDAGAP